MAADPMFPPTGDRSVRNLLSPACHTCGKQEYEVKVRVDLSRFCFSLLGWASGDGKPANSAVINPEPPKKKDILKALRDHIANIDNKVRRVSCAGCGVELWPSDESKKVAKRARQLAKRLNASPTYGYVPGRDVAPQPEVREVPLPKKETKKP